jgi:hypothetical protein
MNTWCVVVVAAVFFFSANAGAQAPAGMGSEEFGMSHREMVRAVEQVEQLIQDCMGEQGFQYIAVDYDTIRAGMRADKR